MALLTVVVTAQGVADLGQVLLACASLLFLVTLTACPYSLPLASAQQPISHLHLGDEATRLQGWSRGHAGLPSFGNFQGSHVLAHLCSAHRGAD